MSTSRDALQTSVRAIAPWLSPTLQSTLALLDKSFDVRPSPLIEERLGETVEAWRAELRCPLEGRYDPQFLDAQSFTQLMLLVVEATIKERLSEKRRMYGQLLARADTAEHGSKPGQVEEALNTLVQVSEADLLVLKIVMARVREVARDGPMEEGKYRDRVTLRVEEVRKHLPDFTALALKTHLTRLERLGLVLQMVTSATDVEDGQYTPTHILEELTALVAE